MTDEQWQLAETPERLLQACAELQDASWLAIDSEFVRERTYRARLCLLQISNGPRTWLIDTLALDMNPVLELLSQERIVKVLHSADQDYEVFAQLWDHCPRPLFDTQIAAAMLGLGDQLGYAGLVKARLDLDVDKSMARTDWARRPLPRAALDYAAGDVIHLGQLYPELRAELDRAGRTQWALDDSARHCDESRYRCDPSSAWQRLKGLGRLPAADQHVAAAIAAWREQRAESRDKPRRWILSDGAILVLAQRKPETVQAVIELELDGVNQRNAQLLVDEVLSPAYATRTGPELAREVKPDAHWRQSLKTLQNAVREIAEKLELPPGLLAPKSELAALLDQGEAADIELLKGWRRDAAGARVLEVRNAL